MLGIVANCAVKQLLWHQLSKVGVWGLEAATAVAIIPAFGLVGRSTCWHADSSDLSTNSGIERVDEFGICLEIGTWQIQVLPHSSTSGISTVFLLQQLRLLSRRAWLR